MPTIIFKAIEKCNSNCAYCDVVDKKEPRTMSVDLLVLTFKRINQYLEAEPGQTIDLIWHGGEPCLLGKAYYNQALTFQDQHCSATKSRIKHHVQSNLTAVSQGLIDVFKKMGIDQIGTSFEPIPGIRGMGENRDSLAYNKMFMKGIRLLRKNRFRWGIIYVVTKKSLDRPLDLFFFLSNLCLNSAFSLNNVLLYEDAGNELAVTPAEYADFLGAIFPVWYEHRDLYPEVEPFKSYMHNYQHDGRQLSCNDSGGCARQHIYIGPQGETSQCGRAGDWDMISYGNITDRSLQDIFEDKQREVFERRNDILIRTECKDCIYWGICHGGCPLDAYSAHGDFNHKSDWCRAKQLFLKNYFEPVTGLTADFSAQPSHHQTRPDR